MAERGAPPGAGRPKIYAVVALEETKGDLDPGDAILFFTRRREEQEELALLLARILGASTHDLGNGSFIIVAH